MRFNYIIFHKGCFDGFTGFYLFTKTKEYEPKPFIYPDYPGATQLPPEIEGKRVVIIDVAYRPSLLKQIAEKAEQVLFIDHHQTHETEIKSLNLSAPHQIVFRNDRCGATLVWDHFLEGKMIRPQFLDYIEDNDLGRWQIPETLPFIAALEVQHRLIPSFENLRHWDQLLRPSYLKEMLRRGQIYEEQKDYLIQKMSRKYDLLQFPSQKMIRKLNLSLEPQKVAVVSGSGPFISLIGKQIAENTDCAYCLLWRYQPRDRQFLFSFRSTGFDVGEVAKQLGGGGHRKASGASVSAEEIPLLELFDPLPKRS